MTTTYANLVDEVFLNLSGYTLRQDRTTHLTQDVTDTGLLLNLGDTTNIGKGAIEIDDELLWLDSYDRVSATAAVAPYGRGYHGTTAVAHTTNTKVTIAPTFPKLSIKKAINDTIDAIFPNLFAVGIHTFTYNTVKTTYSLPADTQTVLYVSYKPTGPTEEWLPVRNYRADMFANTSAFATAQSISIYDRIEAGRTVQVYYTKKSATFSELATPVLTKAQVFETVTGLPSSCKDVIVYGAAYRLASFIDPGRLNYSSAEADQADSKIQYGSGASTTRFLLALYQQRLNEETKKLRDVYPTRIHYTRY
jgi:hypothetical protein